MQRLKKIFPLENIWIFVFFDKSYLLNVIVLFFCVRNTEQKMKFSIKDFFSKCDQIRSFLRIWSHLLKKSLMENFIFCAVKEFFSNNSSFKIKFEVANINLTDITLGMLKLLFLSFITVF